MIIQCVVLAIEGTDNSCPNDKRRGWCWLILKKGHGIWPCQSKFETLHCIAWIEGVKVNRPCFIQRRIFSCSARRRDLFDTASDGVVATVMLGVCDGPAWGHWILTSFTHGCRSAQHHNGGLPLVFSHSSALADRTLSRQKMDDRSSWPLNTTRVASCPCMTKEPPPQGAVAFISAYANRFRHLYRSQLPKLSHWKLCPFTSSNCGTNLFFLPADCSLRWWDQTGGRRSGGYGAATLLE